MAIRYDKKIEQEINRTIRNFNQKIARLEKDKRELILPERVTKKQIKENVYTRAELKQKLQELQRFGKRGAEETVVLESGYKVSAYELENLKRENRKVKAQLTRQIKSMESSKPKVLGKTQASTFAQMGDQQYLNLKARRKALEKDIVKLDKSGFKQMQKLINKTKRHNTYMNSIFKENYMQMLSYLGYYFNYDKNKMDVLYDKMLELKPNDFLKLFQNDKSIKAILDYYPIITGTLSGINPSDIEEDVNDLYDALYDNINSILKDYA